MKGVIMQRSLPTYHYAYKKKMSFDAKGAKLYGAIIVAALIVIMFNIIAPESGTITNQSTGLDYNLVP